MLAPPNDRPRSGTPLDQSVRVLERGPWILLGLLAIVIPAGAVFLMLKMDGGSRSQGGRFYVAIAALVALAAVDSQFRRLVRRSSPPSSLVPTAQERRYGLVSLLLLLTSTVVLIGLAWLLP